MHLLVNALSVTNISGRHVLFGLLRQFARAANGADRMTVLYHRDNTEICRDLDGQVAWRRCPDYTARWAGRAIWEQATLPTVVRAMGADVVFSPAGTLVSSVPVAQVPFGQNPLALINGVHRSPGQHLKAALQRRAYRVAMRRADFMLFNSNYMRQAYRHNAGFEERDSEIVYLGLDADTLRAAGSLERCEDRDRYQIACVSVMAPHKDIATVIRAVDRLRVQHRVPARLVIVGPWADRRYEYAMRRLVAEKGLAGVVEFRGGLPHDELHQLYATSRVFCLMSRSESFGIPAVEAQAFGTPVVGANCCATPEVCGQGGLYASPGDDEGAAEHLARLISDDAYWSSVSDAAHANAAKYRWENNQRALSRVFEVGG